MNYRLLGLTAALMALAAVSLAEQACAVKPGGWSEVSVTDEGVVAAAAFAVRVKQAAMREEGREGKLSLEEVATAEQQVVQGMNYRLTLRVLQEGKARTAEAIVWARIWLDEAEQYQLTSWRFTDALPRVDHPLP
jgi:hypothetical protein